MTLALIYGDNDFEKRQELFKLAKDRGVDRYDGEEVTLEKLRELATGQTLFAANNLSVIDGLSDNSDIWNRLPEILTSDADIVLAEGKIDKRTKTYKWLVKTAKTSEHVALIDRQRPKLTAWVISRAKDHGYTLDKGLAEELIDRLGYDQMRLDRTLEQLSLAETIDKDLIDRVVPLPRTENVFELFEAALRGERSRVHDIIAYLELTLGLDGAYQTLGLLVSQLVPLNALVFGGAPGDIAKDFSTHPFLVQKLGAYARQLSASQVRQMNEALGRADMAMKSTTVSPWLLLENALIEMSVVSTK